MNETGIQPVEYKVLVEVIAEPQQTQSGLWIPDATRERSEVARAVGIIAAAGGLAFSRNDPTAIEWPECPKVGDKVFFDKYSGSVIKSGGKSYRLLNDKNVAAIITTEIE